MDGNISLPITITYYSKNQSTNFDNFSSNWLHMYMYM